jgi:hypothetical protein
MTEKFHGWVGVDLDGTLAVYDGWVNSQHIGEPIGAMLFRVKKWLADGIDVRIFTARVSHDGTATRAIDAERARSAIKRWCIQHIGREIPITNIKDYAMAELYDDRAVQVEENTGRLIGHSRRGLS